MTDYRPRRTALAALLSMLLLLIFAGAALAHHATTPGCEQITFVSEKGFSATATHGDIVHEFGPFGEGSYPTEYTFAIEAGNWHVQFYDAEGKAEKDNWVVVEACEQSTPTPTPTPEVTPTPRPTPHVTGSPPATPHVTPHTKTLPPTDTTAEASLSDPGNALAVVLLVIGIGVVLTLATLPRRKTE